MTYKQLDMGHEIPSIDPNNPGQNFKFYGEDIPLLVGVSKYDPAASYLDGHTVIYNTTEVKGLFLVNSNTSPGDAPDGSNYDKFTALSLAFVPNAFTRSGGHWDITKQRTGRLNFGTGTTYSSGINQFYVNTQFDQSWLAGKKIIVTLGSAGLVTPFSIQYATCGSSGGQILIGLNYTGSSGSTALNGRWLDFTIEG